MVSGEFIADESSYDFFRRIDDVCAWSAHPDASKDTRLATAEFDMIQLGVAVGLTSAADTMDFITLLADHKRQGPSYIHKQTTRNEITLLLGRGFDLEPIRIHFPIGYKWEPSWQDTPGRMTQELHADVKNGFWTVNAHIVPDPHLGPGGHHGFTLEYNWDREKKTLSLFSADIFELGEMVPEKLSFLPSAQQRTFTVLGVGNFSVPGVMTEQQLFANLVFPYRMQPLDVQEHGRRGPSEDDVIGIGYAAIPVDQDV
jgi:hypothetical protein